MGYAAASGGVLLLSSGATLAGGLEIPRNGWWIVPRAAIEFGSAYSNSYLIARSQIGTRSAAALPIVGRDAEAGIGMAYLETVVNSRPVHAQDEPPGTKRQVVPTWYVLFAGHLDREDTPDFLFEVEFLGMLSSPRMDAVCLRAGLRF